MCQDTVTTTAFSCEVLANIGQAARGHAHRLQAFNNGRQVHRLLGPSALHLPHFLQHREHRANELRIVFFWHVPFIKGTAFNHLLQEVLVVARILADVFKNLNEHVKLRRRELKVTNVLANGLF